MLFSRLRWGKYGAVILVKIFFISTKITITKQIVFKRLFQIIELKKGSFEINKKFHFFQNAPRQFFCSEAVIRSALLNNECHKFPKQRVIKYTVNVNKINVYLLNTRKCTCHIFMNNDFELKKKIQKSK